ncbi:MAG: hypothetical protein HQ538_00540 [Parcubacteria group bacterium]|nr:hypothetical protein [Parcubacteria group bacterium]
MFKRILQIILVLSITALITSYFLKDQLPEKSEIDERLYQEPIQEHTDKEPFEKRVGDITYNIKPITSYELYGLVVTYNNANKWWDYYHKVWNDFINLKDICVIWNKNIDTEVYKQMKFKSGSWTCYMESKYGGGEEVRSNFSFSHLSNNHLLDDNEEIAGKIMEAEIGDQIYFKGYLVEYSHSDEQFKRGTSTLRTDTGNNACETVYVTDFEIIKKKEDIYREIYKYAKYPLIGSILLYIASLFISPMSRKKDKKK